MHEADQNDHKERNAVGVLLAVLWGGVLWAACCPVVVAGLSKEAFPGAQGWAAYTPGGRGGRIVRVTTLDRDGPGSFAEAVRAAGPRIIVFEVGGVIDLDRRTVNIGEPYVTIAGQTAPSPGITFIRGGIGIQTHDVVVQHIRVRPGEAGAAKKSGWEVDGIATSGACNVIIDHCSCTWSTDENLSASGPRFEGETVEQWRQGTSRCITFSNNIIAEGLANSTHGKGRHSKGTLIHDNATEIAIIGNLYAHNRERNALFKGGARGVVVNNYIYDPGARAIHYALVPSEWGDRERVAGQVVVVGNVLRYGPSTVADLPLLYARGDAPCDVTLRDNIIYDRDGRRRRTDAAGEALGPRCRLLDAPPLWPPELEPLPAGRVREYVTRHAGARPWDRDAIDKRIVTEALRGTGRIIDSEQEVGGYPRLKPTRASFDPDQWDLDHLTRR